MATVVGGYMSGWNGAELDGCQYHNEEDYLAGTASASFAEWVDDSMDTGRVNFNNGHSTNSLNSESKQVRQYWRLRQFFNAIQKSWHNQGQVTAEELKHFPLILFSPVLDRVQQQRKDPVLCSGYFTDPNLATPRTASESDLFADVSEQTQMILLSEQFSFNRLSAPMLRQCNSENNLAWSSTDKHLPNFGTDEPLSQLETIERCGTPNATETSPRSSTDEEARCEAFQVIEYSGNVISNSIECCMNDVAKATSVERNVCSDISSQTELEQGRACVFTCFTEGNSQLDDQNACSWNADGQKSESPSSKNGTTSRIRKSVSFADECGQSLAEVHIIENSDQNKTFEYEVGQDGSLWTHLSQFNESLFTNRFTRSRLKHPHGPLFARDPELTTSSHHSTNNLTGRPTSLFHETKRALWVLCFPQPASQYYEFRQRVEHGSVSLENITLTQPDEISLTQLPQLSGTIKVKNLSYEKQVWIRLTTDNWRSFTDFVALYSPKLSGGLLHSASRFDTFTFHLNVVPQMEREGDDAGDKIEFAVRYLVGPDGSWGQYWDNNGGKNYLIEKRIIQSSWPCQLNELHNKISLVIPASCDSVFDGLESNSSSTNTGSNFNPYTQDFRPNFEGISQFTSYRAWTHFAGETTYY